ncbi:trimethylguanosine synthase [Achroia grisella]|uniref:trimethylguanosine synthase n=1 Tax=Achroia grisella TaxID=688607 RepID=UPI0027D2FAA1|nr:trimethylguanosine synthase [Achroia grisella]
MMSEYYDHYHRWEPLAEFQFAIHDDPEELENNYLYCLCSRVFLKDGIKTYYAEKEDASESDVEVLRDSQSQEWDEHSHVHFSLDTSYKVKCEKDEGASCYCSASHTDNYCSTDEHDPAQIHGAMSHALQPSDSGADLTYQDCHSDYTHDQLEKMDQDFQTQSISEIIENYLSEDTWEKFWAVNGERIIWASWIKKYSDYINPAYLDDNNELVMDDNNIPKEHSADQIFFNKDTPVLNTNEDGIRERKFSYDSKVNPYKKSRPTADKGVKNFDSENKEDTWFPLARKRSCSEHDRILSPRTIGGTDSMTNITKITISSYDITSSHVTSESTPTDDYSVSSSTSDDQSNDQTRIININESTDLVPSEELDTEQYWQFLWKKHFGEQYALHYANYIEYHDAKDKDLPEINVEMSPELVDNIDEKPVDIECENSEGNSQEMPSVIEVSEVLTQIDEIKLDDKVNKPKKRNKKTSNRYLGSVGVLLQNLLKEEQKNNEENEVFEGAEKDGDKVETVTVDVVDGTVISRTSVQQPDNVTNYTLYNYDDGDDDPPEEKPVSLKRSHEMDEEEIASEKVKSTFEIMGFSTNHDNVPKGQLVYRKRLARLRPPRHKRFGVGRKTYYDDDGNAYQPRDSYEEREIQTDEDMDKSDSDKRTQMTNVELEQDTDVVENINIDNDDRKDVVIEAADVELPPDLETSFSDAQDNEEQNSENAMIENTVPNTSDTTKRRRRNKRHSRLDVAGVDVSDMPAELKDDPKMFKYWKKRHSLFHRFDEGIKLDRESWFSVTPEQVARHIASKFSYDVVLDAFCGAGGNTIQFANTCKKVIAVDIDPAKIEMAKHNAEVYGVADRIEFIVGDFFELAPTLQADMVFLSPPWGGPTYSKSSSYDLETMLEPRPASELMTVARNISSNIALYVPRNTKSDQLLTLAKTIGGSLELEQSYLDKRFVAITAYFYN